jgi:hypothetical protein
MLSTWERPARCLGINHLAVLFVPQVRSLRAHQAPAPSLLGAES